MTPERWEQVRGVLGEALELAPGQRSVYLDRACSSDPSLRREVETLLASSDDMHSSFLHSSPLRVTLTSGTKLGEYEVKSLLGSGGMGEVYRARDSRLGRDVAIKVLPSLLSADSRRLWRFEQEAQAAAALNHPNIFAVFQMGTYEGAPYLVSELLEGETLREQIKRGRLSVRKAIDYGVQIARGLAAAHEKGIVHRDLKPENLFVTKDGRVKILDFGLAKLTQPQSSSEHAAPALTEGTEPGVVMGTAGYMSPEQVRGHDSDHRADFFAFGAILYEMLAGKRAFQKSTSADTMSAILNEDPPAVSQVTANIPSALQRVVHRCLEKNPEQRFQSASDLAFALDALSEPSGSGTAFPEKEGGGSALFAFIGEHKLWMAAGLVLVGLLLGAVLYSSHNLTRRTRALPFRASDIVLIADFENHTGDPRFDDALQTAFTVSIGQSRYVNAFPRSRVESVLKRMGRSGTERVTVPVAREICARENARGLIASTITRTGQEFELTAELIDPETGATVRSYKERSYGEDHILDALDSIAKRVRADLGESLYEIHQANRPLPQVTTSSLTALKEYAEASSLWAHTKYDDAVSLYKAAIVLDPDFAMAHAALGRAYCSYIYYQTELGRKEYERALALASRLTDRERMVIEAHKALDLDHAQEADGLYRSYLTTYPDDWNMLRDYANLLRRHGREAEAIEQHKRILAIAPDDAHTWIEMATAYSGLGNFSAAVQAYSHAFQIEPSQWTAGNISREYGMALIGNGEEQKAVAVFSDLLGKPARRADALRSLALLDLYHGRYSKAQVRLQEALQIDENNHNVFPVARTHFILAVVAEGRGDSRTLLQQLDAAAADLKNMGPKVEWGSIVGQEYVRVGALAKAAKLAEFITPLADAHDSEQKGYVHLLHGAIAAERGETEKAVVELTLIADPTYGRSLNGLATETVAHAYQRAGNLDQAIVWYEKLDSPLGLLAFWEPQQRWAFSRYQLAADYQERGQTEKARRTLATLLDLWKDADANIPLRKAALQLQARLYDLTSTTAGWCREGDFLGTVFHSLCPSARCSLLRSFVGIFPTVSDRFFRLEGVRSGLIFHEEATHRIPRRHAFPAADKQIVDELDSLGIERKFRVLGAMRSKAATSTTENFFLRASAMRASSPGRRAFFPQTPRSSYSCTTSNPLCDANSRRSYN
jgi:serine/threonine protein kinase/tetratricopeptide (TPR) repeat protein